MDSFDTSQAKQIEQDKKEGTDQVSVAKTEPVLSQEEQKT